MLSWCLQCYHYVTLSSGLSISDKLSSLLIVRMMSWTFWSLIMECAFMLCSQYYYMTLVSEFSTSAECRCSRNCQEVITFVVGVQRAGTVGAKCCAYSRRLIRRTRRHWRDEDECTDCTIRMRCSDSLEKVSWKVHGTLHYHVA